ncbi:MAG TPA: DUF6326 family protein [Thermoplasmata archaeon]|nr:DUF6326 family protein [Thermoplasmata archaeon]
MKDIRTILSTLWIFYVLNSAYGDITTLYTSVYLHPASSITYSPTFILFGAIIVEPAIVMIVLSRVLANPTNRWANLIVAGLLTIVNVATLFVGIPTPAYAFITGVMIAAGIAIILSAWRWVEPAAPPLDPAPGNPATTFAKPIDALV